MNYKPVYAKWIPKDQHNAVNSTLRNTKTVDKSLKIEVGEVILGMEILEKVNYLDVKVEFQGSGTISHVTTPFILHVYEESLK